MNKEEINLGTNVNWQPGYPTEEKRSKTTTKRWHMLRLTEASKTVLRHMRIELDDKLKVIFASGCSVRLRSHLIRVRLQPADFDQSLGPVFLAVQEMLNKYLPFRRKVLFLIVSAAGTEKAVLFKFWPNILH